MLKFLTFLPNKKRNLEWYSEFQRVHSFLHSSCRHNLLPPFYLEQRWPLLMFPFLLDLIFKSTQSTLSSMWNIGLLISPRAWTYTFILDNLWSLKIEEWERKWVFIKLIIHTKMDEITQSLEVNTYNKRRFHFSLEGGCRRIVRLDIQRWGKTFWQNYSSLLKVVQNWRTQKMFVKTDAHVLPCSI